jgi:hypothetical protein
MSKARRSPRSAIPKIARLADHPDECLVLDVSERVRKLIRYDADENQLYVLVENCGVTMAEEEILHSEAVAAAEEGEVEYRTIGYYRASQCPADRPGGNDG